MTTLMEPTATQLGSAPSWTLTHDITESSVDTLDVHIMMAHDHQQIHMLEETLIAVSDPRSERYGKHLSIDDLTELIAPSVDDVSVVTSWLDAEDVAFTVNRNRDVITLNGLSAAKAETLFATEISAFAHNDNADAVILRATEPYSLPTAVAEVVSVVEDLIRFPYISSTKIVEAEVDDVPSNGDPEFDSCGSSCSGFTTPQVLASAYNIASEAAVANNSMAVAEFQYQFWDSTDLSAFSSACGVDTVTVDTQVGPNTEAICSIGASACIEALLDIEYIKAVAPEIPLTVFNSKTFSLADWATTIGDQDDSPWVHSVSYGNDEVQQTSVEYMQSVNVQFMKLGSRGISILFASGDQGVWGRSGSSTGTFNPDFPAASPYVTAVGGTDFATKSSIAGGETTWADGGGGFSNTFGIPDWQSSAVADFFSASGSGLPAAELYNASGRGYPDVAALGGQVNSYCVAYGGSGKFGGVAGTSASCPVVAAIFAKLNGQRLSAGGAPLGFLNPFIYQNSDAFQDVTSGTNDAGLGAGFTAIAGWDAATGWGTPDYALLKAAL